MFKDTHFIDIHEDKGTLVTWTRGMDGKLITRSNPLQDYLYCFMRANTEDVSPYKDIYGYPLKKVEFDNKRDLRAFATQRDDLCESDVQPAYKMILDEFVESPVDAPYNIMFYDIENDFDLSDGRGYPLPSNPFAPINSFQYFDVKSQRYGIVYVCDKPVKTPVDDDEGLPVDMLECKDEKELISTIAALLDELDVDVLAGWFTNGYDLPMMIARATILFGERQAKKLFCRNGYSARSREYVDDFGNDAIKWTLVGRQHLDMMELYKKFIPSEKKSFSLSNVCLEDLELDKVDYDGDLGELYREDPDHFFDYAFWDAKLLKLLDDKHQIIQLAMAMARVNCVKAGDVTGAVRPIEHGLMKFAHRDGIRLPDKKENVREKFAGAIVYDTVNGKSGYGFTVDLTALYPSTMKMLGLSPETMIMELREGYADYVRVMSKSKESVDVGVIERGEVVEWVTMCAYELEGIIRENGYTISAAGIVFNGEFGLLARYVDDGMTRRNDYRRMMRESTDPYEIAKYNLFQNVTKITNNSVYGCSGEVSFRLFDLRLSVSITMSARIISKWQAFKANECVNMLQAA